MSLIDSVTYKTSHGSYNRWAHSVWVHSKFRTCWILILPLDVSWRRSSRQSNRGMRRLKGTHSLNGTPMTELRDVTCHMGSHSVTCYQTQVNAPLTYLLPGTWRWRCLQRTLVTRTRTPLLRSCRTLTSCSATSMKPRRTPLPISCLCSTLVTSHVI